MYIYGQLMAVPLFAAASFGEPLASHGMKTWRKYTSCNAAELLSSPESPGNIYNTIKLQFKIELKSAMCYYLKDVYSCGCSERGPFIQCPIRRGTNTKCARLGVQQPRAINNYCPNHLVGPAATVTYDQGGGGDGEQAEGQDGQGGQEDGENDPEFEAADDERDDGLR